MKIVLPRIEHLSMLVMLILFFLPWKAVGPVKSTGIDICINVIKNGGSLDHYFIAATLLLVMLALLLALTKNSGDFIITLAAIMPLAASGYAFFKQNHYFASLETAYILVLLISLFILVKRFGIVSFQK